MGMHVLVHVFKIYIMLDISFVIILYCYVCTYIKYAGATNVEGSEEIPRPSRSITQWKISDQRIESSHRYRGHVSPRRANGSTNDE